MVLKTPQISELRCPCIAKTQLREEYGSLVCSGKNCMHSELKDSFRIIDGCAVLISQSRCNTICDPNDIGSRVVRSSPKLSSIRRFMGSGSELSKNNCSLFVDLALKTNDRARILVIGSGEPGVGTEAIWSSNEIDVFGTDIYYSSTVSTICDAHYLPFTDGFFDGVWIQAVLEHVVDPQIVVQEIFRVLNKDGLVYSEIPFMQQVHEGAFDFTRLTLSGHRFLFKNFETIKLGVLDGPGAALSWSFRYWIWSLTRSRNIARAANILALLIIKPFVYIESKKSNFDSYSGSFFMGKKSAQTIQHKDLLGLYKGNVT